MTHVAWFIVFKREIGHYNQRLVYFQRVLKLILIRWRPWGILSNQINACVKKRVPIYDCASLKLVARSYLKRTFRLEDFSMKSLTRNDFYAPIADVSVIPVYEH